MLRPAPRSIESAFARGASLVRDVTWLVATALVILAVTPRSGSAQFGLLKKIKDAKDAMTAPDSATRVKDSLAKIQSVSAGDVATAADTAKKSLFSRAKSAATKASDKVESTTGVSVKDAALAASGVGIAGVAAKKLGVDPTSLAQNATAKMMDASQKKAAAKVGMPTATPQGGASLQAMQQQMQALQAMQANAMKGAGGQQAAMTALAGMPDAQLLLAFQQEMMQVVTEATAGNAAAKAKLEAWNALSLKYQAEARPLTTAASTGDMTALTKLQALQANMIREWVAAYGSASAKALLH